MAEFGFDFDATQVKPSTGTGNSYPSIPPDWYMSQFVQDDEELRVTNSGEGKYIWLEGEIIEGDFAGSKFEVRLNIYNPSQEAERIGRSDLSAICHAIKELHVSTTKQLLFKSLWVKLITEPGGPKKDGSGNWPDKSVPKAYIASSEPKPAFNAAAQKAAVAAPQTRQTAPQTQARPNTQPPAQQPPTASPGRVVPPWQRNKAAG